jgi:hypothetical protein
VRVAGAPLPPVKPVDAVAGQLVGDHHESGASRAGKDRDPLALTLPALAGEEGQLAGRLPVVRVGSVL